jgi:hypothetical protein
VTAQTRTLLAIVQEVETFHSPDGTGFVVFSFGGHRETWPVRSPVFKQYLSWAFYETEHTSANAQGLREVIELAEARAKFDGHEERVFIRAGEYGGSLWLDLGDADWRAIEITDSGWGEIANPPIRFRRTRGMLSLPLPVRGGSVAELRPFINTEHEDDWVMILCWVVAAMRFRGPYPILKLTGEQGAAKSTAEKVLRALVDPSSSPLRAAPRNERDLQIAAKNSHVIALDNMSYMPQWLSDALCRLATGGGLSTRQLYNDDEEILFDAQRPILLNGIEDLGTNGDFLERSIGIHLPAILNTARRDEGDFWAAFHAAQPQILGGLLDALSVAHRELDSVRIERNPRMADFAKWAVAAEPGLGIRSGAFLSAYSRNRLEASTQALDSSPLVPHISALTQTHENWTGTSAELLVQLNSLADDTSRSERGWPRTPRALSGALRRLAPDLRTIGIRVIFLNREATRRPIALSRLSEEPSGPSSAAPAGRRSSHSPSGSSEQSPATSPRPMPNDGSDAGDDGHAPVVIEL